MDPRAMMAARLQAGPHALPPQPMPGPNGPPAPLPNPTGPMGGGDGDMPEPNPISPNAPPMPGQGAGGASLDPMQARQMLAEFGINEAAYPILAQALQAAMSAPPTPTAPPGPPPGPA